MKPQPTYYWLGAVGIPPVVFATAALLMVASKSAESDWLGGKFIVVTAVACLAAIVSSLVLTVLSMKAEEKMSGIAMVGCVIYLGLCAKQLFS